MVGLKPTKSYYWCIIVRFILDHPVVLIYHSLKTRLFVQLLYTYMCSHLVTAGASSTVVIADFVRLTNVCDSTTIISIIIIIIIIIIIY